MVLEHPATIVCEAEEALCPHMSHCWLFQDLHHLSEGHTVVVVIVVEYGYGKLSNIITVVVEIVVALY